MGCSVAAFVTLGDLCVSNMATEVRNAITPPKPRTAICPYRGNGPGPKTDAGSNQGAEEVCRRSLWNLAAMRMKAFQTFHQPMVSQLGLKTITR